MIRLLLASRSPRRRDLIKLLNYPFQCIAANVDENSITHPDPAVNVVKTAQLKANTIATEIRAQSERPGPIIVAADTTVSLDGQMLGKPIDESEAHRMLVSLRERTHHVHTGITLIDLRNDRQLSDVHTAVVTMRAYTDDEIRTYVATRDPMDKAGAYAIQHPGFRPVIRVDGCFTGVMGLSICHLIKMLRQLSIPTMAKSTSVHAAHQQYPCPLYDELTFPE